jgi:hypothetical protein
MIIRVPAHPRYRWSDLLKRVRRSNIHATIETGAAVGREAR